MTLIEWTQVAVAIIAAIGVVAAASTPFVLPVIIGKRRREKRAKEASRTLISEIHDNTANTHSTLLREDVDLVLAEQAEIHGKLDAIHELLTTNTNLTNRVMSRLDRHRGSITEVAKRVTALEAKVPSGSRTPQPKET